MTRLATNSSAHITPTSTAHHRRVAATATARGEGAHGRHRRVCGTPTAPAAAIRVAPRPERSPEWAGGAGRPTVRGRSSYRLRRALVTAATVAGVAAASSSTAQASEPAPYSAHSMVYTCCTPQPLKERMFSEAKALRSSYIRLDVEIAPIFENQGVWRRSPDWSKVDEVIALSRRYRLPVVGVLRWTPTALSSCPGAADPGKCPPTDYLRYGSLLARIAAHARGTIRHWEVINEPDGAWAFRGSAEQYAWLLRRAYDGIKSAAPEDRVLIGGVMGPDSIGWLARVFDTAGADARHRFDVANVHLRGTLDFLRWGMAQFRSLFSRYGFHGPLWVTEHGYPGETRFQRDPGFRGGDPAQARYLRRSLPALVQAGADQVFLTLRDATRGEFGDSEFASEGVLRYGERPPYPVRHKQSFALVRWLAGLWPTLPALAGDPASWRRELGRELRREAHCLRLARRERRLARRLRARALGATSAAVRQRYGRIAADHERKRRAYAGQARLHRELAGLLGKLIAG